MDRSVEVDGAAEEAEEASNTAVQVANQWLPIPLWRFTTYQSLRD
jgi:hypothetical protein